MNSSQTKTALVVDDEEHVRFYLVEALKRFGTYEVHQAKNGLQALQHYQQYKPRLILLDINMPEMSGSEVLKEIRKQDDDVTVVMVTAVSSQAIVEECADLGADYFISKGSPPKQIHEELANIFNKIAD